MALIPMVIEREGNREVQEIEQVKYSDQLILTTDQIAQFYGTEPRRINENFNRNKERFEEGKHYFKLDGSSLKAFKNDYANCVSVGKNTSVLYLWTKRGAARHAKMLGTDKAWEVFELLEESYFKQQPVNVNTTPLQLLKATVDAMVTLEEKQLQQERDLKDLRKEINSPFSVWNSKVLEQDRRITFLEDKAIEKIYPYPNNKIAKDLSSRIYCIAKDLRETNGLGKDIPEYIEDIKFFLAEQLKKRTGRNILQEINNAKAFYLNAYISTKNVSKNIPKNVLRPAEIRDLTIVKYLSTDTELIEQTKAILNSYSDEEGDE